MSLILGLGVGSCAISVPGGYAYCPIAPAGRRVGGPGAKPGGSSGEEAPATAELRDGATVAANAGYGNDTHPQLGNFLPVTKEIGILLN